MWRTDYINGFGLALSLNVFNLDKEIYHSHVLIPPSFWFIVPVGTNIPTRARTPTGTLVNSLTRFFYVSHRIAHISAKLNIYKHVYAIVSSHSI